MVMKPFMEYEKLRKEDAYLDTQEGARDDFLLLDPEERKVVGLMHYWKANIQKVAEDGDILIETVVDCLLRPHVQRALAYYYNNPPGVLKKAVIANWAEQILVSKDGVKDILESKDVPKETKRKMMRDLFEMDNLLPKYPTPQSQTNVQVNITEPDWKK